MLPSVEARCIVCHLIFCCGDCRWKHEQTTHGLQYNCPICRGSKFLCKPEELNLHFLKHLTEEHLPLQCRKCNQVFETMDDLMNIDKCISISELAESTINLEEKFDSIYKKVSSNTKEGVNYEGLISIDKNSKTAIVTPIVRKKHLVDYEYSDSDEEEEKEEKKAEVMKTPHPKFGGKTPKPKAKRAATPHVKKLLTLMRQKVVEEYEMSVDEGNDDGSPKTTPSRNQNSFVPDVPKEMTTPTSQMSNLLKLAEIVTTSTPTHPVAGGWTMFPEQGADSPLSEIENADSPAQSTNNEPSKSESEAPKLKSIIISGSRIRLGSQDSSEKNVAVQESNTDSSIKKKVKFADDTVFEQQAKVKRVYRKPKRMLTPGPQKPRFCFNPRFQALINRFESQVNKPGQTMARTPVHNRDNPEESTPPVGEHSNMPARAINFKEESPLVAVDQFSKESNDLYKTCIDSPEVNSAITALTANIAGSLQSCLNSVLQTTEDNTEIQFKLVITKKKFSFKRVAEDPEDLSQNAAADIERNLEAINKDNIWSSVARAVKNAFWGEQRTSNAAATPHRSVDSIHSSGSSGSKRKIEDISDSEISPLNHKRHKYDGRIRGRPPLRRTKPWVVSALRTSQSAEQPSLMQQIQDDALNLSF